MRHLAILLMLLSPVSQAATFVVDTTADSALSACTAAPADCSLRGAIAVANTLVSTDKIDFNIPMSDSGCDAGSGVCRIVLIDISSFSSISSTLLIDGYTQPGASPNTIAAPGANDAQIKIEITSSFVANDRFVANNATLTLRGVAMFLPGGRALSTFNNGSLVLEGNWFGVTAAGETPDYTTNTGVISAHNFNTPLLKIGGSTPAERNVFAGSGRDLDGLVGGGANEVRVRVDGTMQIEGNLFGLAPDGVTPLPFRSPLLVKVDGGTTQHIDIRNNRFVRPQRDFSGTFGGALQIAPSGSMTQTLPIQGNVFGLGVDGSRIGVERDHIEVLLGNSSHIARLLIGGLGVGEGNIFAAGTRMPGAGGALGSAVKLPSESSVDTRVEIVGNTMLGNDGLGLDFPHSTSGGGIANGRTLNDANDADTGANNLQNFPKITSMALGATDVQLGYRVDSLPANSAYPLRIDFYRALGDEGEILLDSDVYTAAFAQTTKQAIVTIPPGVGIDQNDVIVAVATDADGRSSEFSFDVATLSLNVLSAAPKAGLPLEVEVVATAVTGPFKPNGVVRISINTSPAASCDAVLEPGASPGVAVGTCELIPLQSGSRTLSARLDTLQSAFATADGADPTASTGVTLAVPGPEQIGFASCRGVALEGRDLLLSIARPSGGIGTVQVDFSHEAGTATPDVDYDAPLSQTLIWSPGELDPKQIVIPIASDGASEPNETFHLRLSNPQGAAIQPHDLTEITILDGDEQGFRDGFEGNCPE